MSHIGAHSRSLERIERLCRSVNEARALRTQVLDELRRVIGFQALAWIFTDP